MPNICSKYSETLGKYFREHKTDFVETFDISTKTTTQQGIKLTPEIKAIIKGEAIPLKAKSSLLPKFQPLAQEAQKYNSAEEFVSSQESLARRENFSQSNQNVRSLSDSPVAGQSQKGGVSESALGGDSRGTNRREASPDRVQSKSLSSSPSKLGQGQDNLDNVHGTSRSSDTKSSIYQRLLTYSKDTTSPSEIKVAPVDFSVVYKDSTKGGKQMLVPLKELKSYVSGLTDEGGKTLKGKGAVDLELTKDGDFSILDGNHRIQQAIEDGYTHIPARVQIEKGAEQFVSLSKETKSQLTEKWNKANKKVTLPKNGRNTK